MLEQSEWNSMWLSGNEKQKWPYLIYRFSSLFVCSFSDYFHFELSINSDYKT